MTLWQYAPEWLTYEAQATSAHNVLLTLDAATRLQRPDDAIAVAQVHAVLALAAAVAGHRDTTAQRTGDDHE